MPQVLDAEADWLLQLSRCLKVEAEQQSRFNHITEQLHKLQRIINEFNVPHALRRQAFHRTQAFDRAAKALLRSAASLWEHLENAEESPSDCACIVELLTTIGDGSLPSDVCLVLHHLSAAGRDDTSDAPPSGAAPSSATTHSSSLFKGPAANASKALLVILRGLLSVLLKGGPLMPNEAPAAAHARLLDLLAQSRPCTTAAGLLHRFPVVDPGSHMHGGPEVPLAAFMAVQLTLLAAQTPAFGAALLPHLLETHLLPRACAALEHLLLTHHPIAGLVCGLAEAYAKTPPPGGAASPILSALAGHTAFVSLLLSAGACTGPPLNPDAWEPGMAARLRSAAVRGLRQWRQDLQSGVTLDVPDWRLDAQRLNAWLSNASPGRTDPDVEENTVIRHLFLLLWDQPKEQQRTFVAVAKHVGRILDSGLVRMATPMPLYLMEAESALLLLGTLVPSHPQSVSGVSRARWILQEGFLPKGEALHRARYRYLGSRVVDLNEFAAGFPGAQVVKCAVEVALLLIDDPQRCRAAASACLAVFATERKVLNRLAGMNKAGTWCFSGADTTAGAALACLASSCVEAVSDVLRRTERLRLVASGARLLASSLAHSATCQLLPLYVKLMRRHTSWRLASRSAPPATAAPSSASAAKLWQMHQLLTRLHHANMAGVTAAAGVPRLLQWLLTAAHSEADVEVRMTTGVVVLEVALSAKFSHLWQAEVPRLGLISELQLCLDLFPPATADSEVLLARLERMSCGWDFLSVNDCEEGRTYSFHQMTAIKMHALRQAYPAAAVRAGNADEPLLWDNYLLRCLESNAWSSVGGLSFGCCRRACTNLCGGSDATLPLRRCGGCRLAGYCSLACQRCAWRTGHRAACREWCWERTARDVLVRLSDSSAEDVLKAAASLYPDEYPSVCSTRAPAPAEEVNAGSSAAAAEAAPPHTQTQQTAHSAGQPAGSVASAPSVLADLVSDEEPAAASAAGAVVELPTTEDGWAAYGRAIHHQPPTTEAGWAAYGRLMQSQQQVLAEKASEG